MKVDKDLVDLCEKAIQYRLGDLEDIPDELANTAANVYYKFLSFAWDTEWGTDIKEIDNDRLHRKIDEIEEEYHVKEVLTDNHPDPGGMLMGGIDALEKARQDSVNPLEDLGDTFGELVGRSAGVFQSQATREFVLMNISLHWLRMLAKHPEQFKYYTMMVESLLDVFKYRIERTLDKNPLRRKLERKFKKRNVDEIPNLIDLMNVT